MISILKPSGFVFIPVHILSPFLFADSIRSAAECQTLNRGNLGNPPWGLNRINEYRLKTAVEM